VTANEMVSSAAASLGGDRLRWRSPGSDTVRAPFDVAFTCSSSRNVLESPCMMPSTVVRWLSLVPSQVDGTLPAERTRGERGQDPTASG
jgi:hypothetical protein